MRFFAHQYYLATSEVTNESSKALHQFDQKMVRFLQEFNHLLPRNLRLSATDNVETVPKLQALNFVFQRIFSDLNNDNFFGNNIQCTLNRVFSNTQEESPGFIDAIRVESVTMVSVAPIIQSIMPIKMKSPHDTNFVADQLTLQGDVSYNGKNYNVNCLMIIGSLLQLTVLSNSICRWSQDRS